ncbi:MAG: hypothetical protein LDLANPLL_00452 [Turneriella sp.]|nr:hypothetical protein [Turneriella sp.]
MDQIKLKSSLCEKCLQETQHKILFLHSVGSQPSDDYHAEEKYFTLECAGCGHTSFRYEMHDYEGGYTADDGEWIHDIVVKIFPNFLPEAKRFKRAAWFPDDISNIYVETTNAIKDENLVLAGAGLRMIIEAIAIDKKVPGKHLENQITNLQKKGLISKLDSSRLHAIRFLGNDAVHALKAYEKEKILLALEILQNLLTSLYGFEGMFIPTLELPINSYKEFRELVLKRIGNATNLKKDHVYTISAILGNENRRILRNTERFEKSLKKEIQAGKFKKLSIENAIHGAASSKTYYKILT